MNTRREVKREEEADLLIEAINKAFANDEISFYTGTSYRHCMIVHNGEIDFDLTPPHDVLGKPVKENLPRGNGSEFIETMMRDSYEILKNHPVNVDREKRGLNPANTIWIWGQGKKPALSSFSEKYGINGAAISAVDLIKGIAICAGLESIEVEGATGTLHTNFQGKADATIEAFRKGADFIYLHLEGPDECSHQGDLEGKIKCLELIDEKVLSPILRYLQESGEDYRILVLPDHKTPLSIRTHTSEPVPFVIFDSRNKKDTNLENQFNEKSGANGVFFESGHKLADYFFKG